MRILLTGHLGQLATDFKAALTEHDLILTEYDDLKLQDAGQVLDFVNASRPDLILNCAAYNRVDEAEDRPEDAFAANTFGVRNLALAARACDAVLVHFSTDYVFDEPARAVPYTEDDTPCPRSMYGISKLGGELVLQATWHKHFIFRVCGLYGYAGSRDKGSNFVETMLALAGQGKPLRVVNDQILTPTCTLDIVDSAIKVFSSDRFGLYHFTAAGSCSWYDFARAIFEEAGVAADITPVTSDAYRTNAHRPAYSVLDNFNLRRAGFEDLPDWQSGLRRYLAGRPSSRPQPGEKKDFVLPSSQTDLKSV